jgi:hypothetical protein
VQPIQRAHPIRFSLPAAKGISCSEAESIRRLCEENALAYILTAVVVAALVYAIAKAATGISKDHSTD